MTLHLILEDVLETKFTYLKAEVALLLVRLHGLSDDPPLAAYMKTLDELVLTDSFMLLNFPVVRQICTTILPVLALELKQIFKLVLEWN